MADTKKVATILTRLRAHVPFLKEMISNLKKDMPQHSKILALHNILTDSKRKYKYDTLIKCEEVILKLQAKSNFVPPPENSKANNLKPPATAATLNSKSGTDELEVSKPSSAQVVSNEPSKVSLASIPTLNPNSLNNKTADETNTNDKDNSSPTGVARLEANSDELVESKGVEVVKDLLATAPSLNQNVDTEQTNHGEGETNNVTTLKSSDDMDKSTNCDEEPSKSRFVLPCALSSDSITKSTTDELNDKTEAKFIPLNDDVRMEPSSDDTNKLMEEEPVDEQPKESCSDDKDKQIEVEEQPKKSSSDGPDNLMEIEAVEQPIESISDDTGKEMEIETVEEQPKESGSDGNDKQMEIEAVEEQVKESSTNDKVKLMEIRAVEEQQNKQGLDGTDKLMEIEAVEEQLEKSGSDGKGKQMEIEAVEEQLKESSTNDKVKLMEIRAVEEHQKKQGSDGRDKLMEIEAVEEPPKQSSSDGTDKMMEIEEVKEQRKESSSSGTDKVMEIKGVEELPKESSSDGIDKLMEMEAVEERPNESSSDGTDKLMEMEAAEEQPKESSSDGTDKLKEVEQPKVSSVSGVSALPNSISLKEIYNKDKDKSDVPSLELIDTLDRPAKIEVIKEKTPKVKLVLTPRRTRSSLNDKTVINIDEQKNYCKPYISAIPLESKSKDIDESNVEKVKDLANSGSLLASEPNTNSSNDKIATEIDKTNKVDSPIKKKSPKVKSPLTPRRTRHSAYIQAVKEMNDENKDKSKPVEEINNKNKLDISITDKSSRRSRNSGNIKKVDEKNVKDKDNNKPSISVAKLELKRDNMDELKGALNTSFSLTPGIDVANSSNDKTAKEINKKNKLRSPIKEKLPKVQLPLTPRRTRNSVKAMKGMDDVYMVSDMDVPNVDKNQADTLKLRSADINEPTRVEVVEEDSLNVNSELTPGLITKKFKQVGDDEKRHEEDMNINSSDKKTTEEIKHNNLEAQGRNKNGRFLKKSKLGCELGEQEHNNEGSGDSVVRDLNKKDIGLQETMAALKQTEHDSSKDELEKMEETFEISNEHGVHKDKLKKAKSAEHNTDDLKVIVRKMLTNEDDMDISDASMDASIISQPEHIHQTLDDVINPTTDWSNIKNILQGIQPADKDTPFMTTQNSPYYNDDSVSYTMNPNHDYAATQLPDDGRFFQPNQNHFPNYSNIAVPGNLPYPPIPQQNIFPADPQHNVMNHNPNSNRVRQSTLTRPKDLFQSPFTPFVPLTTDCIPKPDYISPTPTAYNQEYDDSQVNFHQNRNNFNVDTDTTTSYTCWRDEKYARFGRREQFQGTRECERSLRKPRKQTRDGSDSRDGDDFRNKRFRARSRNKWGSGPEDRERSRSRDRRRTKSRGRAKSRERAKSVTREENRNFTKRIRGRSKYRKSEEPTDDLEKTKRAPRETEKAMKTTTSKHEQNEAVKPEEPPALRSDQVSSSSTSVVEIRDKTEDNKIQVEKETDEKKQEDLKSVADKLTPNKSLPSAVTQEFKNFLSNLKEKVDTNSPILNMVGMFVKLIDPTAAVAKKQTEDPSTAVKVDGEPPRKQKKEALPPSEKSTEVDEATKCSEKEIMVPKKKPEESKSTQSMHSEIDSLCSAEDNLNMGGSDGEGDEIQQKKASPKELLTKEMAARAPPPTRPITKIKKADRKLSKADNGDEKQIEEQENDFSSKYDIDDDWLQSSDKEFDSEYELSSPKSKPKSKKAKSKKRPMKKNHPIAKDEEKQSQNTTIETSRKRYKNELDRLYDDLKVTLGEEILGVPSRRSGTRHTYTEDGEEIITQKLDRYYQDNDYRDSSSKRKFEDFLDVTPLPKRRSLTRTAKSIAASYAQENIFDVVLGISLADAKIDEVKESLFESDQNIINSAIEKVPDTKIDTVTDNLSKIDQDIVNCAEQKETKSNEVNASESKKENKKSIDKSTSLLRQLKSIEDMNDDENLKEENKGEICYVEPDKNYYIKKELKVKYPCKVCKFVGRTIVAHYAIKHPNLKCHISRLSPEDTAMAVKDIEMMKSEESDNTVDKKTKDYICRFCLQKFDQVSSLQFYNHLTSHTSEFRFLCTICSYKCCDKDHLKGHYSKVHDLEASGGQLAADYTPPSVRTVYGYVCSECNYLQLNKLTVEEHIEIYHLDDTTCVQRINMSLECTQTPMNSETVETPTPTNDNLNAEEDETQVEKTKIINATITILSIDNKLNPIPVESKESVASKSKDATKPTNSKSKKHIAINEKLPEEKPVNITVTASGKAPTQSTQTKVHTRFSQKYRETKTQQATPVAVPLLLNELVKPPNSTLTTNHGGIQTNQKLTEPAKTRVYAHKPAKKTTAKAESTPSLPTLNLTPKTQDCAVQPEVTPIVARQAQKPISKAESTLAVAKLSLAATLQDCKLKSVVTPITTGLPQKTISKAESTPVVPKLSLATKVQDCKLKPVVTPIATRGPQKTISKAETTKLKSVVTPITTGLPQKTISKAESTPAVPKLSLAAKIQDCKQKPVVAPIKMPPLTKLSKIIPVHSESEDIGRILSVAGIDAITPPNKVHKYICRRPSCIFTTNNRKVFENHCVLTHKSTSMLISCKSCDDKRVLAMVDAFKHLCEHVDEDIVETNCDEVICTNETPKFSFKIASVTSLAGANQESTSTNTHLSSDLNTEQSLKVSSDASVASKIGESGCTKKIKNKSLITEQSLKVSGAAAVASKSGESGCTKKLKKKSLNTEQSLKVSTAASVASKSGESGSTNKLKNKSLNTEQLTQTANAGSLALKDDESRTINKHLIESANTEQLFKIASVASLASKNEKLTSTINNLNNSLKSDHIKIVNMASVTLKNDELTSTNKHLRLRGLSNNQSTSVASIDSKKEESAGEQQIKIASVTSLASINVEPSTLKHLNISLNNEKLTSSNLQENPVDSSNTLDDSLRFVQIANVVSLNASPEVKKPPKPACTSPFTVLIPSAANKQSVFTCRVVAMSDAESIVKRKSDRALKEWKNDQNILGRLFKCPIFNCLFTSDDEKDFSSHLIEHKTTSVLPCLYCNFKMKTDFYTIHLVVRHKNCRYGCSKCLYRAICEEYVKNHILEQHKVLNHDPVYFENTITHFKYRSPALRSLKAVLKPYICKCGKNFYSRTNYATHSKRCHGSPFNSTDMYIFNCRYCDFKDSFPTKFMTHMAQNHPYLPLCIVTRFLEDPDSAQDDEDDTIFDKLQILYTIKLIKCSICLSRKLQITDIRVHMKQQHKVDFTMIIPEDPKKTNIYSDDFVAKPLYFSKFEEIYEYGVENMHTLPSENVFKTKAHCKHCNFSTCSRALLLVHMGTHKNKINHASVPDLVAVNKRYTCGVDNCNAVTTDWPWLKHHLKAAHSSNYVYKCPHCMMEVNSGDEEIYQHLMLHGAHLFRCINCPHLCVSMIHMKRHYSMDHPNCVFKVEVLREMDGAENKVKTKPTWKCTICHLNFPSKAGVVMHGETQHGNLDHYQCNYCDFKGFSILCFGRHFESKHPGIVIKFVPLSHQDVVKTKKVKRSRATPINIGEEKTPVIIDLTISDDPIEDGASTTSAVTSW